MTSRAENTFLGEKFNVNGGPPAGWLGGWDNTEGTWEWMNGPRKGRRFLSANTTCGGTNKYHVIRGAGNGAGTASAITRQAYDQTIAMNGSTHEQQLGPRTRSPDMRYNEYSESIDSTTGRVTHPSKSVSLFELWKLRTQRCWPLEDKLQMTGNNVGERLWNFAWRLEYDYGCLCRFGLSLQRKRVLPGVWGPLKSEWASTITNLAKPTTLRQACSY